MTQRKIASIESKLTAAIRRARAQGFRITRGEFSRPAEGRSRPRCCPIEALCPGIGEDGTLARAARKLGVTVDLVWPFVEGLDDVRIDHRPHNEDAQAMYDLGTRIRRQFRIR